MTRLKTLLILGATLAISACAQTDTAMRNAAFVDPADSAPTAQEAVAMPSVSIVATDVRVPETLKVSEANLYYPIADIVWRGEPLADRHAQVKRIFEDGIALGQSRIKGSRDAVLHVEVKRFHALTEKARYTIGGSHSIKFDYYLTDAETGDALSPVTQIDASFEAFGGARAIAAERNGITQRHRITQHLAAVLSREIGAAPAQVAQADVAAAQN